MIEGGLEDLSISRSQIDWGIPVPWDPEQVVYVWVDALFNYWTALGFARPGEDLTARYWPPDVQLMAKDILKFHAVIWPALLMAAGLELPRRLFVHGYVLKGGERMSKTTGNVVDPFPFIERYGIDALRYYLAREVRFGEDGTFAEETFEARYDRELANELGNLLNRTVAMVERYRDGVVPADPGGDAELAAEVAAVAADGCDGASTSWTSPGRIDQDAWAPRAPPQPPGRGARAVEPGQGPGARRRARPGARSASPRACASPASCCGRTSPARPSGPWPPWGRTRPPCRSPARRGAAGPGRRRRPDGRAALPADRGAARSRHPRPPRLVRGPAGRAGGRGRRRRGGAGDHDRDRARVERAGRRPRRGAPRGVGGGRRAPARRGRLESERDATWIAELGRAPARGRDRRVRPGLPPRPLGPRRAGPRLRRAARARPRGPACRWWCTPATPSATPSTCWPPRPTGSRWCSTASACRATPARSPSAATTPAWPAS